METEKVILELLGRVIDLENRVTTIESMQMQIYPIAQSEQAANSSVLDEDELNTAYFPDEFEEGDFIPMKRSEARALMMEKLVKFFKTIGYKGVNASVANREQGGGIVLYGSDFVRPVIIRFYYSRSYSPKEGQEFMAQGFGWYTVNLKDVVSKKADLILFALLDICTEDYPDVLRDFVFSLESLQDYKKNIRNDQSDSLHLYLVSENDVIDEYLEYSGDYEGLVFDSEIERGYERRGSEVDISEHYDMRKYLAFTPFLKDEGKLLKEKMNACVRLFKNGEEVKVDENYFQ